MPLAVFGLLPSAQQQRDLLVTADQRRQARRLPRLEAPFGPTLARDPPGGQRLGEALEALRPEVVELEQAAEQPPRRLADDHAAGRRERLQSRREIRRLADHRFLARRAFADQLADHDQTGRDADPGRERLARGRLQPRQRSRPAPARRAPPAPPRPRAPAASRNRRARRRPCTWRHGRPSARPPRRSIPDRRGSPRPCPRDRAAPPARSSRPDRTNSTVSCRRSASGARDVDGVGRSAAEAASGSLSSRIALSSLTRWPSGRPSSLRCSSVSSTSASAIDRVVGEQLGILAKALGLQPLSQLGHDRPPRGRRHNLEATVWAAFGRLSTALRVADLGPSDLSLPRGSAGRSLSCWRCGSREMQCCPVPARAVARARCSAVPFLLALWLGGDAVLSRSCWRCGSREMQCCPVPARAVARARCSAVPLTF